MIAKKGSHLNQLMLSALLAYISSVGSHHKESGLIYILEWTTTYSGPEWPYRYLEMGREAFTSRNCSFQNCFVTSDRSYLDNIVDYDIVIINAVHYTRFVQQNFQLPHIRFQNQQYLLFSVEPAAYNRVPDNLNGNINLTWTYKLNSDIVHPYFLVKNNMDEIIGPKIDMQWININDLPPVNRSIIRKLKNKSLAAIWIGSNCYSKERIVYILKLQNELRSKYGLQLDMFGKCGNETACKQIPTDRDGLLTRCYDQIESDYYFYLAFENSNSEDYVSEKVLHALNHFTVPIVYGGADYTRFLPDGIYLDAKKLGAEGLAKEMHDIINDPPRYYDFFKWHGYYSFHDTGADNYSHAVCEFCAFLNNEKRKLKKTVSSYESIVNWWNVPAPDDFQYLDSFRYSFVVEEKKELETTTTLISRVLDFFLDV